VYSCCLVEKLHNVPKGPSILCCPTERVSLFHGDQHDIDTFTVPTVHLSFHCPDHGTFDQSTLDSLGHKYLPFATSIRHITCSFFTNVHHCRPSSQLYMLPSGVHYHPPWIFVYQTTQRVLYVFLTRYHLAFLRNTFIFFLDDGAMESSDLLEPRLACTRAPHHHRCRNPLHSISSQKNPVMVLLVYK
jgi:hypothetical protein